VQQQQATRRGAATADGRASRSGAAAVRPSPPRPDRDSRRSRRRSTHRAPTIRALATRAGYILPSNRLTSQTATSHHTLRYVGVTAERGDEGFHGRAADISRRIVWVPRRRRSGRTSSTCSSRRDHPERTSAYPGGRRSGRTTTRATRSVPDGRAVRSHARGRSIVRVSASRGARVAGAGTVRIAARPDSCFAAQNDAFHALSWFVKSGASVSRLIGPLTSNGKTYPAGSSTSRRRSVTQTLDRAARRARGERGSVSARPRNAERLEDAAIALFDTYAPDAVGTRGGCWSSTVSVRGSLYPSTSTRATSAKYESSCSRMARSRPGRRAWRRRLRPQRFHAAAGVRAHGGSHPPATRRFELKKFLDAAVKSSPSAARQARLHARLAISNGAGRADTDGR